MEQCFDLPNLEAIDYIYEAKRRENTRPLLKYISENLMIGLYDKFVSDGVLPKDDEFAKQICIQIENRRNAITSKYDLINTTDAFQNDKKSEESTDDVEVYKKHLAISEFIASTCDYAELNDYIHENKLTIEKGSTKMDLLFCKFRILTLLQNRKEASKLMDHANYYVIQSCDWDRRNKFKTYYGVHCFINKDYHGACEQLHDSLPTFDSKEVFSYDKIVLIYILSALMSYDRENLRKKVYENGNVNETRESNSYAIEFVEDFIKCEYKGILVRLYMLSKFLLRDSPLFFSFQNSFIKKMLCRLLNQLLQSYRSLSIDSIAEIFGVSSDFIEEYLFDFIVNGEISAKIDGINKNVHVIETKIDDDELFALKGDLIVQNIAKNIKM